MDEEKSERQRQNAESTFNCDEYSDPAAGYRWGNVPDELEERMRDGMAYAEAYIQQLDIVFDHQYGEIVVEATPGSNHTASIMIGPQMMRYVQTHPESTLNLRGNELKYVDGVERVANQLLDKLDGRKLCTENIDYPGYFEIVLE